MITKVKKVKTLRQAVSRLPQKKMIAQYEGDYDTLPEQEDTSLLKYSLADSLKVGSLWVSKFPLIINKSQRRNLPSATFSPGGTGSVPEGSVLIYLGQERQNFAIAKKRVVSTVVHAFFINGMKVVVEKFNTIQPAHLLSK